MHASLEYLDRIPKAGVTAIGIILVLLLGWLDLFTGYEISFSIFYLLPVSFVAWFDNKFRAVMVSIFSSATWMWADISSGHIYSNPAIPAWNALVRLGFFLMAVFLLAAIRELLEREKSAARVDYLTGVANSRAFYDIAKIEIERSVRFNRQFSIAYIDIDNFKQVNDSFGHSEGDNLLLSVATTIKNNIRSIDVVSRLGGDEFAILFPETNDDNLKTAVNKINKVLISAAESNNWPITFSVGVVTCYQSCDLDELIREADNLMYSVKKSGKNRIAYNILEIPTGKA